jgi:hypothetical protein
MNFCKLVFECLDKATRGGMRANQNFSLEFDLCHKFDLTHLFYNSTMTT